MSGFQAPDAHTFHIPVMGTGFTIDTPLKVARYGISSVISMVDDELVEQMREYHAKKAGEPFEPIPQATPDVRAKRFTAYFNLLDRLVKRQMDDLRSQPFEKGADIMRYFRLLPDCPLKSKWLGIMAETDPEKRRIGENELRSHIHPGGIDVNIMTKLDREPDIQSDEDPCPGKMSDALTALRGFAMSTLNSSMVCSAGMNQRFYSYFADFDDFFPQADGSFNKKIVLKVSDFRSAQIQGRFLVKRGLWVSEYRIESGLNCGGHAFATKGSLMGPILDEFKHNREGLNDKLFGMYRKTLESMGREAPEAPPSVRVTVQGGIGTAEEDRFLQEYYSVDGTGWGTPFLLVPEVVNVDEAHLEKLAKATDEDVYMSNSSPLGVPFWNLRNSASEEARRRRIADGNPGSPCRKGYLRIDNEFPGASLCKASSLWQRLKLTVLAEENLPTAEHAEREQKILEKSCICHDLAGGVTIKNGIDPKATPAICCGPNIVNFPRIFSLEEMVDHIYGRISILAENNRPHMFVSELMIYADYLREETEACSKDFSERSQKYIAEFQKNLLDSIEHYHELAEHFFEEKKEQFLDDLAELKLEIEGITVSIA